MNSSLTSDKDARLPASPSPYLAAQIRSLMQVLSLNILGVLLLSFQPTPRFIPLFIPLLNQLSNNQLRQPLTQQLSQQLSQHLFHRLNLPVPYNFVLPVNIQLTAPVLAYHVLLVVLQILCWE